MLERLDFLALGELVHPRRVAMDAGAERVAEATRVTVMVAVGEDGMRRLPVRVEPLEPFRRNTWVDQDAAARPRQVQRVDGDAPLVVDRRPVPQAGQDLLNCSPFVGWHIRESAILRYHADLPASTALSAAARRVVGDLSRPDDRLRGRRRLLDRDHGALPASPLRGPDGAARAAAPGGGGLLAGRALLQARPLVLAVGA